MTISEAFKQRAHRKTQNDATRKQRKRTAYTRRPWSEEEKDAVQNFFSRQRFTSEKPGKKEFDSCIAANPILNSRSWKNVKDYFYNTFKRK